MMSPYCKWVNYRCVWVNHTKSLTWKVRRFWHGYPVNFPSFQGSGEQWGPSKLPRLIASPWIIPFIINTLAAVWQMRSSGSMLCTNRIKSCTTRKTRGSRLASGVLLFRRALLDLSPLVISYGVSAAIWRCSEVTCWGRRGPCGREKNQAASVPRESGAASRSDSASSWNPASDLNSSRTR